MNKNEKELSELRKEIDKQDLALLEALARRFALVRAIAELKKEQGSPLRDLERERQILEDRIARGEETGIDASLVTRVFELVIGHSLRLQRRLMLGWAGLRHGGLPLLIGALDLDGIKPDGVIRQHFLDGGAGYQEHRTAHELVRSLLCGQIEYGVVPLLRMDGTIVSDVFEELLHNPLAIVGEEKVTLGGADEAENRHVARFVVIAREPLPPEPDQGCETAFIFKPLGGAEGLAQSLWVLKQHGVELSSFHQVRDSRRKDFVFLVFVVGTIAESPLRDALEDLLPRAEFLKVMGSYPTYEPLVPRPSLLVFKPATSPGPPAKAVPVNASAVEASG